MQEIAGPIKLPPQSGEIQLKVLDALPASRRAEMRQRYIKSLLREIQGEPTAGTLLDKNPSPTQSLDVWLRVFPELKVIIALRDPRDVVISCFFLNIMLNATNVNFLSLERTARHYADLMDVWLRLRELGGFDWIESRYEDVVGEPGARRPAGHGVPGSILARKPGAILRNGAPEVCLRADLSRRDSAGLSARRGSLGALRGRARTRAAKVGPLLPRLRLRVLD